MSVLLRLAGLRISPCSSALALALTPTVSQEAHAMSFSTNSDKNPHKYRHLYEKEKMPYNEDYKTKLPFSLDTYLDEEAVSKLPPHLHPKYLPKKIQNVIEKRKALKAVSAIGSDQNTNYRNEQISISCLSSRIDVINDHIQKFPKDKSAKHDRRIVKYKRKLLLRFLKRKDFTLYEELKQKYNLEELDVCIDPYTYLNRHLIFKKGKRIDAKKVV